MFDDDVAMMVFSYAPCYTCHRVSVVSSYIAMRVTAATGGAAGKTAAPPQGLVPARTACSSGMGPSLRP